MPSSSQMSLISLNVYNCTSQPQIIYSFNSSDLQYTQIRTNALNSNHHSIASIMHSSIINTQINTFNLQVCICLPTMLQSPNLQAPTNAPNVHQLMHLQHEASKGSSKHLNLSRSTPLVTSNQISNSKTYMNGPIT